MLIEDTYPLPMRFLLLQRLSFLEPVRSIADPKPRVHIPECEDGEEALLPACSYDTSLRCCHSLTLAFSPSVAAAIAGIGIPRPNGEFAMFNLMPQYPGPGMQHFCPPEQRGIELT